MPTQGRALGASPKAKGLRVSGGLEKSVGSGSPYDGSNGKSTRNARSNPVIAIPEMDCAVDNGGNDFFADVFDQQSVPSSMQAVLLVHRNFAIEPRLCFLRGAENVS